MDLRTKFNQKNREQYLDCIRQGLRSGEAATASGITRQTANRYKKNHPEFAEEVAEETADVAETTEVVEATETAEAKDTTETA